MTDLQSVLSSVSQLRDAAVIHELGGGRVSNSWLVEQAGQKLVLRIDTPLAELIGLNRSTETALLEKVSRAGFGPEVVWADPERGLLLTVYIEGNTWQPADFCISNNIKHLALRLRDLHQAKIEAPYFDLQKKVAHYIRQLNTDEAAALGAQAFSLLDELKGGTKDLVLCHNDLGGGNIIGTEHLMLIDWEYAGIGDPYFDLAVIIRQNQLPKKMALELLCAYWGGSDREREITLRRYCRLYDLVVELWCQLGRQVADTGQGRAKH